METPTIGWTLGELATLLGGTLDGPDTLRILRPAEANSPDACGLSFAESEEYIKLAERSGVGAVIAPAGGPAISKPAIRVDNVRQAFMRFLGMFEQGIPIEAGRHPTAQIHASANCSESARIGAYVVIEAGAVVGDDVKLYPFCYVGPNCAVGSGSVLYPHVVLYTDVTIGERSIIHSHAVLGSDGFGFTWNGERQVKVPQLGGTSVGSDVEIGSGTTIDRATLGRTSVGDGSKIDNQVQIGHNTSIGRHTIVASQAGISGSCDIGDRCTFAGQTGLADHVTIGNDVTLTARAATSKDLAGPGVFRGAPAKPYLEELRYEAALRKAGDLAKRVRELEKKLERLEKLVDN